MPIPASTTAPIAIQTWETPSWLAASASPKMTTAKPVTYIQKLDMRLTCRMSGLSLSTPDGVGVRSAGTLGFAPSLKVGRP